MSSATWKCIRRLPASAVERVLPGTLRISVTERQPVAQAITLQPRRGGGFKAVTI